MLKSLAARIDDYYRALHASSAADGLAVVRRFVKFAGPFLSGQILLDALMPEISSPMPPMIF